MGYPGGVLVAVEEADLEAEREREGDEDDENRSGWKGGTHGFQCRRAVAPRQGVARDVIDWPAMGKSVSAHGDVCL
jgi:hypothetical protein